MGGYGGVCTVRDWKQNIEASYKMARDIMKCLKNGEARRTVSDEHKRRAA